VLAPAMFDGEGHWTYIIKMFRNETEQRRIFRK